MAQFTRIPERIDAVQFEVGMTTQQLSDALGVAGMPATFEVTESTALPGRFLVSAADSGWSARLQETDWVVYVDGFLQKWENDDFVQQFAPYNPA